MIFTLLALVTFNVLAMAPKAFETKLGLAVFVDMKEATYVITYDADQKRAYVDATITLENTVKGHLIFDVAADPTDLAVDGLQTESTLVGTPDSSTKVRITNLAVDPGPHELRLRVPLTQLVEFGGNQVRSAFWLSDLNDRGYLERYLPTNFQYDQMAMTFKVHFIGTGPDQRIYTNGNLKKISDTEFEIEFPDYFNTTCPYFHTTSATEMEELSFDYLSVSGKSLPVLLYLQKSEKATERLEKIKEKTISILAELEADYGAFLHPTLTIYIVGESGGMEYAGATMTSEKALGHELFHSYFARGFLPLDGNAGWIDEALARWRDNGYPEITELAGTSILANHGAYYRATDRQAYAFGSQFMALLSGQLKEQGGLKPFLRRLLEEKRFSPMSTPMLITEMGQHFGLDLNGLFRRYVYGEGISVQTNPDIKSVHQPLSMALLRKLL